jgi:hypothetical protein
MFLPWLAGYLTLIMYVESRRVKRMGKDASEGVNNSNSSR